MVPNTLLNIQLTSVTLRPKVGTTRLNEIRGGPDALLNWLETQLGLIGPEVPKATRVTDLATALAGAAESVFAQSHAVEFTEGPRKHLDGIFAPRKGTTRGLWGRRRT